MATIFCSPLAFNAEALQGIHRAAATLEIETVYSYKVSEGCFDFYKEADCQPNDYLFTVALSEDKTAIYRRHKNF